MAQKDIMDIAAYMKQIDESKAEEEKAYNEAQQECEEQQIFEDAEIEDEIIDKESLGFIDDNDQCGESDDFYQEDDQKDTFEEDISDCMQKESNDPQPMAAIDVEVYNEDGFGEYFADKVGKQIPGVVASVKKTLPNGDLLVVMSGTQKDLEQAFAYYLGKKTYDELDRDDKEDFESRLVFDDGDTLAEADYREAVAHCLDDIDVNASTANLADQDTCAMSVIKEEKAKRFAKKALKCLKEDDFSSLSDEELDKLDKIKDAVENGDKLSSEDNKVWQIMLNDMGYTQEQWNALTPEQQEKALKTNPANQPSISRTGFDDVHIGVNPKTGKKFRYRTQTLVRNPETGELEVTKFNPNYDMEHSTYQHPSAVTRQAAKDAAASEKKDKEQKAKDAMMAARGKDTWDLYDFAQMLTGLDDKERKALMNDLIDAVEKDNEDSRKAGEEILFIKKIFGKKLTLRDFAKAWGKSAPGVMKFADETQAIWRKTLKDLNINSVAAFKSMPEAKFKQFLDLLKINMEGRRSGSIVAGR